MTRLLTVMLCIVALSITAFAHPGRTDSDGGHNDNINGGYHYHHGYGEHQHYADGSCPYDNVPQREQENDTGIKIACVIFGFVVCVGVVVRTKEAIAELLPPTLKKKK